MRFLLILIVLTPALMGARTLGLFRDWIVLRQWARDGATRGAPPPMLSELPEPGATIGEAVRHAGHKLVASSLSTAAACCFAFAAGLLVVHNMD